MLYKHRIYLVNMFIIVWSGLLALKNFASLGIVTYPNIIVILWLGAFLGI